MVVNYAPLYQALTEVNAERWVKQLPEQIETALSLGKNSQVGQWLSLVEQLPTNKASNHYFNHAQVKIGKATDLSDAERELLISQLQQLHPWRKGPYHILGISIDTEWRSDWKWSRLKPHITPLNNRIVLDVGCGNGYHCWRMLGEGARMVVGIDPLLLNVIQFQAIRTLAGDYPVYVIPIGLEQIPAGIKAFETVFSMGVLYHRRSPIDHLLELKECLQPGGELVLETLVIEGQSGEILVPEGRYAKMRNVWFLPSCETLLGWMRRCGFKNCRLIDLNITSTEEQRSTEWMQFHSLKDFLDPTNQSLTNEGLPAPRRAIFLANV